MTNAERTVKISITTKQSAAFCRSSHLRGFVLRRSIEAVLGVLLIFERGHCCALALIFPVKRCFHISIKEMQINEEIMDKEVRLISSDGEQLGIVSSAQALKLAAEKNLDLVKIAPQAKPPVCKIMDYGKYRFEQSKREKEAKKNQRVVEIKEIRLSPNIDVHDFDTKVGHARKFLAAGNKVKVSIRFRGREMTHTDLGLTTMAQFADDCADIASVEKPAKLEGRKMHMFLAPNSAK